MEQIETKSLDEAAYFLAHDFKIKGKRDENGLVAVIFEGDGLKECALNYVNGVKADPRKILECYRRIREYALDPNYKKQRKGK